MQPDILHPEYEAMQATWKKCRDCSTGQRAIHAATTEYLPKLKGQEQSDYDNYLARAYFFNATGRTVEGMIGLIFRKDSVIELPSKDWEQDITLTGKSVDGFAREMVSEAIKVGRGGVLVDHPVNEESIKTKGDAERLGIRPYLTLYETENIINWTTHRIGGALLLNDVFLKETYGEEGKTQIRQLTVQQGFYEQLVWRQGDDEKSEWFVFETVVPKKNTKNIDTIPFFFIAPDNPDEKVQEPPIEDLVYANIAHYMNSADLENGLHISGQPTPYITGVDADQTTDFHIGSAAAWMLPDPTATAGYMQVGAEGFAALENGMDRKETHMAQLGARMLAPEKKAAEAAETAEIRRGGENSVLGALAVSVEGVLRKALEFAFEWAGISGEVVLELNKDYLPTTMSAQALTAWVGAWQSGAISQETFFEGLKDGEVVNQNLSFEDEEERRAESAPALGTLDDSE